MFKFFDYIVTLIGSAIDAIVNFFSMIVFVFEFIAEGVIYMNQLVLMLPLFVQIPLACILAYALIITIIHLGS